MRRERVRFYFQKIIVFSMACCMLTNLAVPVSFAEETKKEPTYMRMDHPLKEENNWDISNELIMPGEAFYIVPKFEVTYDHGYYGQTVTNLCMNHVSLKLGEEPRFYDSKLVRSKMDIAGLTADRTNTYNVWTTQTDIWKKSLESAELDEDGRKQLKKFQEGESTENAGYTNNTNTPIVLEQVRTGSTEHEGTIYGGEYGATPMIVGYTTHNSNCTIRFYEPYYTISYKELSEEEQEGMPDRYYVQREKQELILKTPVRAGCHLIGWSGMAFVDEKVEEGRTIFSFDWEHNMAHANLGDETVAPKYDSGKTVTFNANGGSIEGKEAVIYELYTESGTIFDISDHIPQREGYRFAGWCLKSDDLDGSLIKNTGNYDWIPKYQDDIQVYAKWEEKPKETEKETNKDSETETDKSQNTGNGDQTPDTGKTDLDKDQKPSKISIQKLTAGKKKFTIKWKKAEKTASVSGYQIQYSTDKKFKKNVKTKKCGKKKNSLTVSKLKAKKKYYVRMRKFRNVKKDEKKSRIYGSWSKVRKVKVK